MQFPLKPRHNHISEDYDTCTPVTHNSNVKYNHNLPGNITLRNDWFRWTKGKKLFGSGKPEIIPSLRASRKNHTGIALDVMPFGKLFREYYGRHIEPTLTHCVT